VPASPAHRPLDPAAIRRQIVVEDHDVAPDGSVAVVVRRRVRGNHYLSHLWLVPLGPGGGKPRRLTSGDVRDTRPRFSPDGRRIAFRRRLRPLSESEAAGAGHVRRMMVAKVAGKRSGVRPITNRNVYVTELAWSPDGRRIAFTAEVEETRFLIGPDAAEEDPIGRRIRRTDWRYDGHGPLDRWEHLFVTDTRGRKRARRLTFGDFGVSEIAWRPDGSEIAFVADRGADPDLRPRTTIWTVPTTGGEPHEILAIGGSACAPAFSPDGRWLAAVGVMDRDALDDVSPGIVVGPADGSLPAAALAADLDRPIGPWADTDLNGWISSGTRRPVWADDRTIVALVSNRGRVVPWRFLIDRATGRRLGDPERLVKADAACWTLAIAGRAPDGPLITVTGTLRTRAQELMFVNEGAFETPTAIGSGWQGRYEWPVMRLVEAHGQGGPIETWIASPRWAADEALPTVVDIHGGPLGAWSPTPSLEVALLCARGYRVLLPNIRGSQTYGADWIRPQLGQWGGVDADDVHAAINHAIHLGLADRERLGVLGLSYGGFMVHWLIGTSTRFRAAVSENGVANQLSAWANSDTGPEYCRTSLLGDPFSPEGVSRLWDQSPLRHINSIETPLLMFQADADERCPRADNEQLFTALRLRRREVELILYPGEYHVYATTGRPDRRIDRMTRMLDWFDRFLRPGSRAEAAPAEPMPVA